MAAVEKKFNALREQLDQLQHLGVGEDSLLSALAMAGQAKQQKNPGAVVACIKQLDWMTGLGINSIAGSSSRRKR